MAVLQIPLFSLPCHISMPTLFSLPIRPTNILLFAGPSTPKSKMRSQSFAVPKSASKSIVIPFAAKPELEISATSTYGPAVFVPPGKIIAPFVPIEVPLPVNVPFLSDCDPDRSVTVVPTEAS